MQNEATWLNTAMTRAQIDAAVNQARRDRAASIQNGALAMASAFKRFIAGFRPIRAQAPRKSALA